MEEKLEKERRNEEDRERIIYMHAPHSLLSSPSPTSPSVLAKSFVAIQNFFLLVNQGQEK